MAEQIEQAARTAGRTFNISLAELAGANAGQRNDLLALNQAVYRVPDGTLYTSTGSQLVLAQGLPVMAGTNPLTGGIELSAGGTPFSIGARQPILNNASAGADSGWLPISDAPERFAYQLDSGTTNTGFAVDISADGISSLGQAFTGTWASSTVAEITFPIMFSNPLAKFFRWTVLSGGPLSVTRGV